MINSLLVDILNIREKFKDAYQVIYDIKIDKFNIFLSEKKIFIHSKCQLSNYAHLAACYQTIFHCFYATQNELKFDSCPEDFDMYCINQFLKYNEGKIPF